jgi:hypothetical protein
MVGVWGSKVLERDAAGHEGFGDCYEGLLDKRIHVKRGQSEGRTQFQAASSRLVSGRTTPPAATSTILATVDRLASTIPTKRSNKRRWLGL